MSLVIRLLLSVVLMLGSFEALADWIEESDRNTLDVLHMEARYFPEQVAQLGLREYDSEIMDLREGVHDRQHTEMQRLVEELSDRLSREKHTRVRQDIQIVLQYLRDELNRTRLRRDLMLPFYNLHQELYYSFDTLLDPRNEPERYASALVRLRKYNGREQSYKPVTKLAVARTRDRFEVSGLVGPYRKDLETELANAPRYVAGVRALLEQSGLQGWEEDFDLLQRQLEEYRKWVEKELLPRARDNNQLPPEIYADNLKSYGVRAAPEELIRDAQYAYQFIRSEMKALARQIARQRGWKDERLVPVMRRLKQEQIPPDRILQTYQQRLAEIEAIIRDENIVTIPERDAVIRLATEAESAAVPAPFMSWPQLIDNTGQYGEFVLVQTNPSLDGDTVMDDWSHEAITWALTAHEARPGHEMQFASLLENGTSLAQAIYAFNSANAEGWGLYAESIMHQYIPLEGQLFNLFMRLIRAARMFLDPMVNTGQMTPEQARDFLIEQLALSPAMANSEADRYAFRAPGQATAYYYGYMNLMRLRTEVELALGEQFNQRAFHDFVLAQGLLPPDLLREAVVGEFISAY